MIRINDFKCMSTLKAAAVVSVLFLFAAVAAFGQQTINLSVAPTTATLPDGTIVPMWGYFCGTGAAAVPSTTAATYTQTTLTVAGPLPVNAYVGVTLTVTSVNGTVTTTYTGTVASNTATTLTLAAPGWTTGTPPVPATPPATATGSITTTFSFAGSTAGCASLNPNALSPSTPGVTPAAWAPSATYASGAHVLDSNGNVQVLTTVPAGATSGTAAPTWATTVGATTTETTGLVWTLQASLANYLVTATSWSPVVITVPTGQGLTVNLTNSLSFTPTGATTANTIPTSIVIVGQVGGGLGSSRTTTPSPSHTDAQGCPTWFIANPGVPGQPCTAPVANASGTPPQQGPRVQSMATEVAAGATTTLTWPVLKPGTYLLESGTHPSIQVPMGLIGMLVVTTAPSGSGATAGTAYPATKKSVAVPYNAELPLEFSEIDPVQNKEVDQAVRTAGFSETDVWTRMNTGAITSLTLTSAGTGYTSAPSVGFTGGCVAPAVCGGAAATATLGFGVASVAVNSGGSGYTTPPTVAFTGGEGGTATATLSYSTVASIAVTSGGTGYTTPQVVIGPPNVTGGIQATASATVVSGVITGFTVTNVGSGYTSTPAVTITDPSTAATGAAGTATIAGSVASITVTNAGAYPSTPKVLITGGGGTGATATATLTATSTLALTLTSGGGGYATAPTVAFSGGGGTGAAATAAVGSGGCGVANTCYPPAVNYTPFYYLINGVAFNKTAAAHSVFAATAGTTTSATGTVSPAVTGIPTTGTVLVRVVNAGLRLHVPSIVGSLTQGFTSAGVLTTSTNPVQGFALIAEDGNVLPNVAPLGATTVPAAPRVQTDVLMVPSKVYDLLVSVPALPSGATATPALPIYDRQLSLSGNSSVRDAGMLAYISVNNANTSAALGAALPGGGTGALFSAAVANPDTYNSLVAGQPFTVSDPSKGVIANDINVYGVTLLAAPTGGTITCPAAVLGTSNAGMCANGTFTFTPTAGSTATTATFTYCANGTVTGTGTTAVCSSGISATVTLGPSALAGNPTAIAQSYNAKTASYFKLPSPGLLAGNSDPNGLPLSLVVTTAPPAGVTWDAAGGFSVLNPTPSTTTSTTFSFSYTVQNSQGRTATGTATVTFPTPSNLVVNVLDAQAYNNCQGNNTCISTLITNAKFPDYRWIIEEDDSFWVDPNCTTNTSITTPGCPSVVGPSGQSTVPSFGVNFHTSTHPFVAQGCTGPLSCEGGQTFLNPATNTHVNAVCDLGNGACRPDTTGNGFTPVNPSQVHLDPTKRYYISVLPGDAANPFPSNLTPAACNGKEASAPAASNTGCGHTMSGAPIPPACNFLVTGCTATSTVAFSPVNVLVLPTPLPTGRLSVIVFEDDFPLNGEQDGGGGNGTVAPIEPGLGGFNLVLWDTFGGLGDVTGQNTYDMFNMPLSNGLAGTIDPATGLDACPVSAAPLTGPQTPGNGGGAAAPNSGMTGMIVTCPKYESDNTTLSPLAGQAVIYNLMPEKFSVQAYPGADRIARGEEWLQTNTLDGQHPHDSFIRIGEPSYFQEYGPAGYHVSIGFANPAIINSRAKDVCAGAGTPGTVGPCTNTITGQVDVQRVSRTPDQRLYPSGSRQALSWTQCWVSLGDPDGEDFMFAKCDANGNFKFTSVPGGNWRLTIGDQWNDQIIDGLSTPANVGCTSAAPNGTNNATTCPGGQTLNLGSIGVQQWQANLYTRIFVDDNKNGIWDPTEIGIPFLYTRIYYRDGHSANGLNTDFNGIANFNETYPLFNWYVVEADSTRYKTTGIHTVYDAGGPADGSSSCGNGTTARQCGTSTAYTNMSNTFEAVPLPADLSVPGAVYCATADCSAEAAGFAAGTAKPSSASVSTGRIDPPWVTAEGWAGLTGLSNWIDFGKAPYCAGTGTAPGQCGASAPATAAENGGIHGQVTYASTRPFDDADQMILQPWEPLVPGVTINLYQEGFAADGVTPTLTMVDTTETSSWDKWAQGFYANSTAGSGTGAGQKPYMNCPGQGTNTGTNADLFYFTLFDQPNFLDYYNSIHNGGTLHTVPYNSQYKCYDSMHQGNQIQPAVYDGEFYFPSSLGINPTTGKPLTTNGSTNGVASNMTGTNCTICVPNPDTTDAYRVGTPMLPAGKYVVQVIMPPGYEVYKEEDKNLLIGDNFIAPVTQQFGGLGAYIFIIPDQASVASMYDESAAGYNPNNFQDQTTALGLGDELSGVPGYPGFQDPLWPCVGEQRVVPDYLSLFPQAHEVAPFAGAIRPLCDRKEVLLPNQMNVRVHFAIYTSTHIASSYAGGITDDYTSEFDPFSPQFGEKFAPPNLPVSTKDYLGNEISRVYSDHWGAYDGLTFSSWEVNPPNITGYSPTMMVQCMNDPGPIVDTRPGSPTLGQLIQDPLFNPAYSNFCYEQPFMPGLTNYADTPVVPTQSFVGAAYNNPDCSYPDTTPAIKEVDGDGIGPWVSASAHNLTITALGSVQVNNSAYSGPSASVAPFNQKTITRHYGFGSQCSTPTTGSTTCNTLSEVTIGGVPATISNWSDTAITVAVPAGVPPCPIQQQAQYGGSAAQCGQLLITAGNGKQSIDSVTVTIGGSAPVHVGANQSVQSAIDAAHPGDLLMIDPTCFTVPAPGAAATPATCNAGALDAAIPTQTSAPGAHNELLIMWKPVRLQGVGAVSSVINASAFPGGKLLDPWRRHINCLFGLTLQGVPQGVPIPVPGSTSVPPATTPAAYDPSSAYSCPDSSIPGDTWNYFDATNAYPASNPQIDRLPLEATVGWDATQNGNIAEQLQEPSLMGAFEGAAITVLGKGVDFHGANPWTDGNEGGAFPTVTTLLTGTGPNPLALPVGDANPLCVDGSAGANRFSSNFTCNPSSIDGLTITSSSQGGGGIFAHGWAHHLQIANNRVYNNAGTLTGGISVGQGEFPTPYLQGSTTNAAPGSCSDGTGFITNQHLPYCLQLQVNVHNNYVTNNSSLGDELFSGTLAGAGGVTFCVGNDYYSFNHNWVCGNLSSGEGGGVVHLGEIQSGDIEHNTIALNQSTNPTIPTNGGGIMVQGTPDTDPICGTQIDTDCPPGLSDGTGRNLVINGNLIQGNMAESGSGGGIRMQQVNGTDISTFPGINVITAADEGHTVTIHVATTATLPAVGDSVTIAGVSVAGYNGTFTVTHIGTGLFTYLATVTGLGTGTGGTFTDTTVAGLAQTINTATETGAGVVTITSTLNPTVGDSVTIAGVTPAGYNGTYTVTGAPAAGSFTYTDPNNGLAAGTGGTVTDSNPNQAITALWNGVSITNNVIVNNVAGWDGAGISLQDSMYVSIVNNTIASNDSLASSGVLTQSLGTPGASAPAGSCTSTTGTTSCPQSAGVTSTPHSSLLTTTFAGLTIQCPFGESNTGSGSCLGFSNPQLQNNVIWQNRSFIIGVGSLGTGTQNQQNLVSLFTATGGAAPVQTASGQCSTGVSYWDIGVRGDSAAGTHSSGFTLNPTYSVLDDAGYAASNLSSSPNIATQYCNGSRVPPECSAADGCGGPSGYGVPPGIVDASTPNPVFSLTPSATVDEGNNWINVSWGPLSLSNDAVNTASTTGNYGGGPLFANYALVPASPAIDYVPVAQNHPTTDFFGNPRPDPSNLSHFDVGAVEYQGSNRTTPTLTSITPSSGLEGTVVNVNLTGISLTGATAVNVSGGGIAVSNFAAVSDTQVTATFTISATAALTARNVTVTTPAGTSSAVTFTVVAPSAPTLTSITPASELRGTSVNVTLTGTNFVNGSTVGATPTVAGFSITNVVVVNATTITATFTSTATGAGATPLGNVNIEVANGGGASNALPFAVTGPVLTSITPNTGASGTSVPVTLAGTGLTGTTAVGVSGNGVTVTGVTVVSDTQVTATLNFTAGATGGARNVTTTSPAGTSNAVTFTITVPPGALSSISPTTGARGTAVAVTLNGTGLTGTTAVTVTGGGITVSGITVVSDTQVNATFTISATAALTARNVTVTTPAGTSNPVTFTVVTPGTPTLASISPNHGIRGIPTAVTLTGTGFTPAGTAIHVAAPTTGMTFTGVTVVSATTITATINTTATGPGATAIGPATIYVTTPGGSTGDVTYTVTGPVLTSIAPAAAYRGTAVHVSIFGSGLTGTTAVAVSGGGVTVSGLTVVSDSQVNATFTFTAGSAATARNVTVTAPGGTSNAVTFNVLIMPAPTLTNIAPNAAVRGTASTPNAVPVTLTGTNFFGTVTVAVSGGGVTVSNVVVQSPETITATFTISGSATLSTRNVTVTTAGGTTGAVPFTVQGATLTSISPTSGLRGTTVPVTLTGTNLTGATAVTMNGTGITCTISGTPTATTVNANCAITGGAALTARNVTVATPLGNAVLTAAFQVTGATLAISAPLPALNPTPANTVTETSTVTVSNTASGASAASFTLTANPTINTIGAPAGAAFSIITGGTCVSGFVVNPQSNCTITVQYAPGTSTATATANVTVTGTGLTTASQTSANFAAN